MIHNQIESSKKNILSKMYNRIKKILNSSILWNFHIFNKSQKFILKHQGAKREKKKKSGKTWWISTIVVHNCTCGEYWYKLASASINFHRLFAPVSTPLETGNKLNKLNNASMESLTKNFEYIKQSSPPQVWGNPVSEIFNELSKYDPIFKRGGWIGWRAQHWPIRVHFML